MKKESRPRGGQTIYTPEIADEICERLASGENLSDICSDKELPDTQTVYAWRRSNLEGFAERFARAREDGWDRIAADCMRISDEIKGDTQRDRLRVETRLKLLARWDPKRYGEKLDVTGVPASSVNVLLSTRDKLKRLKRAREESDAPAAIEGGVNEASA